MNKHKLTLMGGPHGELRISAALLHEAVGALLEGARLATRFAVEGESVRKGPRPSWLDSACAVEITGLTAGSAVIAMEAPTLQEADAAKFGDEGQRSLFEEIDPGFGEQTAVDLFGEVLASVIERDADDVVADRALLDICVRFAKVSGDGFDGVQLEGLRGRDEPLVITRDHVPQIELLRDETPAPQAARVAGTLDTISASRSDVDPEAEGRHEGARAHGGPRSRRAQSVVRESRRRVGHGALPTIGPAADGRCGVHRGGRCW
jgi:hypothetical protein